MNFGAISFKVGYFISKVYSFDSLINFELADFDDQIRQILSLQSIGLGQTAEAAAKREFRNKYIKLTPEETQQSDSEIDSDEPGFTLNGGIQ